MDEVFNGIINPWPINYFLQSVTLLVFLGVLYADCVVPALTEI